MGNLRKNFKWYFFGGLFITAVLVWYAVYKVEAHNGLLTVDFFDVGQGDGIFIQTPSGNQILIDGGPDSAILSKLGKEMPFWDRSIDVLILSHPHADHLSGALEVLKRYNIGMVIESGVNHTIAEYDEWHKILLAKNIPVQIVKFGEAINFGDGVRFDIYTPFDSFAGASPKNIHDAAVTGRLVYTSSSILFMGDAEKSLEYQLLLASHNSSFLILNSDILKAGHHGSKTSTSEEFLQAVSPRFAVISSGRKNRYGHPHQEIIDRLNSLGIKIVRTDQDGDIKFISSGVGYRIEK